MIEKKTLYAVTRDLEIVNKTAIIEDGNVLAAKDPDKKDSSYEGFEYDIKSYHDTKERAEAWIEKTKDKTRDLVQTVRKFIVSMDSWWQLRDALGIKKEDYLGDYANSNGNEQRRWYDKECEYAKKLETFIRSRMLDIDGHMIPIDDVKYVQWYGSEDADEYEAGEWKAALTTKDGDTYTTCSANDVRLIWATIGSVSGSWFIDNNINYNED